MEGKKGREYCEKCLVQEWEKRLVQERQLSGGLNPVTPLKRLFEEASESTWVTKVRGNKKTCGASPIRMFREGKWSEGSM